MSDETTAPVNDSAADVPAESTEQESPAVVEGAKHLGDPGKKALDTMKQERDAYKAQLKEAIARLEAKPAEDEDKTAAAVREVEAKLTEQANDRIRKAELRAAATGKLADPADALRFIDPKQFEVSADGDVDASKLEEAIKNLIESKPYLAAQGRKFQGSGDGGARPSTPKRATSIEEAIAAKLAARSA